MIMYYEDKSDSFNPKREIYVNGVSAGKVAISFLPHYIQRNSCLIGKSNS